MRSWRPRRTSCAPRWPRSTARWSCSRTTSTPGRLDLERRARAHAARTRAVAPALAASPPTCSTSAAWTPRSRCAPSRSSSASCAARWPPNSSCALPSARSQLELLSHATSRAGRSADPGAVARIVRILLDNALASPRRARASTLRAAADGPWAAGERPRRRARACRRPSASASSSASSAAAPRAGAAASASAWRSGASLRRAWTARSSCGGEPMRGACFVLRLPAAAVEHDAEEHTARMSRRRRRWQRALEHARGAERAAIAGRTGTGGRADRARHRVHGRGPLPHTAVPDPAGGRRRTTARPAHRDHRPAAEELSTDGRSRACSPTHRSRSSCTPDARTSRCCAARFAARCATSSTRRSRPASWACRRSPPTRRCSPRCWGCRSPRAPASRAGTRARSRPSSSPTRARTSCTCSSSPPSWSDVWRRGRLQWAREECEFLERVSDERDLDAIFARLPRVGG